VLGIDTSLTTAETGCRALFFEFLQGSQHGPRYSTIQG
jgi:hypothetical protein